MSFEYAAETHRRRVLAAAFLLMLLDWQRRGKRRIGVRREQQVFDWEAHIGSLTAHEFRLRYRLSSPAFRALCDLLRSQLQLDDVGIRKAKNSWGGKGGQVITPEVQLAIALRMCAGKFHVSQHMDVAPCLATHFMSLFARRRLLS